MKRLDRTAAALLVVAALLAAGQFLSAFFVHVTARAQPTRAGWAVPPTKTYIQAFGVSEVVLTSLSLAAIVAVGYVLSRRTTGGAGWLAWGLSAVTAVLGLVGFVYLFGAGVCLLLACATVRRHPMATIGASSASPPVEPLKTASP